MGQRHQLRIPAHPALRGRGVGYAPVGGNNAMKKSRRDVEKRDGKTRRGIEIGTRK